MEKITLTSPIITPSITDVEIYQLNLLWGESLIDIRIITNTGKMISHSYYGQDARDKMKALRKANLSIKSLDRRIFEILIADGVIAGTITGVPD